MKVLLNRNEFVTEAQALSVAELLKVNGLPTVGVAVAVNGKVVRKADWDATALSEGDNVTVITAVCGG